MKEIESEFVFALTNVGSEAALKSEIENMDLGWRPSYQHKGFVTFKAPVDGDLFSLGSLDQPLACARRLCMSLGQVLSRKEAETKIRQHPAYMGGMIHHVRYFKRKIESEPVVDFQHPEIADCIGTVVELHPKEFWVGLHLHAPFVSPYPGGDSALVMPPDSPSRAWLKLEEAVRFFDLDLCEKDIVVELGCAPGGVVLALLNRGISVIGVDPAEMAPVVTASAATARQFVPKDRAWFYHCRKPAALASKRDLGKGVTWFMSDMNQSPEVVLKECARFCAMAKTVRGVLITLKLTDMFQIRHKDQWLKDLTDMGFRTTRLQQLSVHHKEFALLGLV